MIPGLTSRLTTSGLAILRLHYSADPHKRPDTAAGAEWLAQASAAYPGGLNSPRWRKEMEIEWTAMGGMKLFPEWEQWVAMGKIVIEPYDPIGYKLYGSYDHGWRNPACYLVHGVSGDGNIVTFWEFYADHVGVPQISEIIKGNPVTTPDGRHFEGNPFAGQETMKVADPSMWAEDQPMADSTNKSVAELFRRYGVYFIQGERGGDTMVAEWLHGHFWKDPASPLYRITTRCPKLVWEIGQQRHKQLSSKVALNADQPEQLVDKDNHAWDSMKMFLKRFPPRPQSKKDPQGPNTFMWWRELAKRKDTIGSLQRRTFRV